MGNRALRRAVFLDRDGVINEAHVRDGLPYPPSASELRIVADAKHSLQRLSDAGFALYVVTNQPDIARGTLSPNDLDAMNERLARELPLDGFYVCPHDDADLCTCRKPLPGLIERAAKEHDIDLASSYLVGDRWKDIVAGQAAAVTTIFIDYAYRERTPDPSADATVTSLQGAAEWILNRITNERQGGPVGR